MNTKLLAVAVGIGALGLGSSIFAAQAFAYRGDPSVQGPNYTPERHEAMTKAFERNDYEAWKVQMQGKGRVLQVVTKENFARFAEAHRLTLAGKKDEALKIRQELGLGLHNGSGQGMGYGRNSR
ncbi:MAG: hypothetical protein V1917_00920 [Candidatus Gottesmanbacteria bacterium]